MEHIITISQEELEQEQKKIRLMLSLLSKQTLEQDIQHALTIGGLVSVKRIVQQRRYNWVIAELIQDCIDDDGNYIGDPTADTYRFDGINFSTDLVETLAMTNILSSMLERTAIQLSEERRMDEIIGLVNAYGQFIKDLTTPLLAAVSISVSYVISSYVHDHPEIIREITGDNDLYETGYLTTKQTKGSSQCILTLMLQ